MTYEKRTIQEGRWEDNPKSDHSIFFCAWAENYFKTLRLKMVTSNQILPTDFRPVNEGQRLVERNATYLAIAKAPTTDHRFLAVIDSLNPKRAFLGETVDFGYGYQFGSVVGAICYFDDQSGDLKSMNPFPHVLFSPLNLDDPDTLPKWDRVFLCGQTLAFIGFSLFDYYTRGRGGQLQLKGFRMNDQENIVAGFKYIRSWFGEYCGPSIDTNGEDMPETKCSQHYGRWLCFHDDEENKYLCLDLKSIRKAETPLTERVENETRQLYWDYDCFDGDGERFAVMYDLVEFSDNLDPKELLATVTDVPSYGPTTWEGYPAKCAKCGGPTVGGIISSGDYGGGMASGLGRGVCPHCMIRYSKSKESWICWNGVVAQNNNGNNNDIRLKECFSRVYGPDYCCDKWHVPPNQVRITEQPKEDVEENDFTQKEIRVKLVGGGSSGVQQARMRLVSVPKRFLVD